MALLILCIALFSPLITAITLLVSSFQIGRRWTERIGSGSIFLSFFACCLLVTIYIHGGQLPIDITLFHWIPVAQINADFLLHVDALSLLMTLIITGIGFLIHLYSVGYMGHDSDYPRYFACLNFFIFSMLLLVLSGHLLLLFVGWEGVGLASYLLIGFWHRKEEAASAAVKAFVVNRIGDLGLLLGCLLTFNLFSTGNIAEITGKVAQEFTVGAPLITLITLLYTMGAIGKSAQLPLHVWLPDAMSGPTPVSALIHAATMVTAGVYLIVRMEALFLLAPTSSWLLTIIGGSTALFAALAASGQTDLKRVLAYSTVSQLGFMFLACGLGAFYAAMFHLTMHAFVKGLLFLSAGNVVHGLQGVTDMRTMGGLAKVFTTTHWLFLLGVVALSGVPPLSASLSKELILDIERSHHFPILFAMSLIAAGLTAFYLTRAYLLTFWGESHGYHPEAEEAPLVMILPIICLGIGVIFGGFIGSGNATIGNERLPLLERFLIDIQITAVEREWTTRPLISWEMAGALFLALTGMGVALYLYHRRAETSNVDNGPRLNDLKGVNIHNMDPFAIVQSRELSHGSHSKFQPDGGIHKRRPLKLLQQGFFIDTVYERLIVKPLFGFSRLIVGWVEPLLFAGSIDLAGRIADKGGRLLQLMQSGQIRSYVAWMVIGGVLMMMWVNV